MGNNCQCALANNKRPEWLANAHRALDESVFAAYGWPADLTRDEILVRLLAPITNAPPPGAETDSS